VPEACIASAHVVRLPWGAWHGDVPRELPVPADWHVTELAMADAAALSEADVERALDTPVDAPRLEDLLRGVRTAAIAIDDITRPAKTASLLRRVVDRLARGGVPLSRIQIIIAGGAHAPASPGDMALKVGLELMDAVTVLSHDPDGDLADTGATLAGAPVRINRRFADADLRIGVGTVMPHPFAGFSGGGKIVIPGLADLDVLARTHKYALMGMQGANGVDGNRFRRDMEQAVRQIGLHWTINMVVNARRAVAFVCAGDLIGAHRTAASAAQRIGATPAPSERLDALVVNAYPKDSELLQIEAALVALRNGALDWLTPDAPVVLAGACPRGLGHHGLFGRGGRLARVPSRKTFLGRRPLIVFAANVRESDVRSVFWSDYPFCRDWAEVIAALRPRLPQNARVGVLPCAPLQWPARAAAVDGTIVRRESGCGL